MTKTVRVNLDFITYVADQSYYQYYFTL